MKGAYKRAVDAYPVGQKDPMSHLKKPIPDIWGDYADEFEETQKQVDMDKLMEIFRKYADRVAARKGIHGKPGQDGDASVQNRPSVRNADGYELERRNFAEFAVASGLNSGTVAQADLAMRRDEAEKEYDTAVGQAQDSGEYKLAHALLKEKDWVRDMLTQAEIARWKRALEQYQAMRAAANRKKNRNR